jgi:hypothetical protein
MPHIVLHDTWFVHPILLAFHVDQVGQRSIGSFLALGLSLDAANMKWHFSRLLAVFLALRPTTAVGVPSFLAPYLTAMGPVIARQPPELAKEIVIEILCVTFLQPSAPTHHHSLLRAFRECEDFCFFDRIASSWGFGPIMDLEEIVPFLQPVPVLRFYLPLDTADKWIDRDIGPVVIAIGTATRDLAEDPEIAPIRRIMHYFSAKANMLEEEQRMTLCEMDEILQAYAPIYQKTFESTCVDFYRHLKEDLAGLESVVDPTQNRISRALSGASLVLLNTESAAFGNDRGIRPETDTKYELDFVYCTNFCPVKVRQVCARPVFTDPIPELGDCLFEHSAALTIRNPPSPIVSFKLYRDHICIADPTRNRVIPAVELSHIFPRNHSHTAVELFLTNGRSYYIYFQADVLGKLAKALKTGNFSSCRIYIHSNPLRTFKFDELWVTGSISNFEYLIWLNFLSGRSFRDPRFYPVFPALLSNFDDPESWDKERLGSESLLSSFNPTAKTRAAFATGLVPPDFFFRPDAIDELPAWANSPTDFVYRMHRLLESVKVSVWLHRWISVFFHSSGLFTKPMHESRQPFGRTDVAEPVFAIPTQSLIVESVDLQNEDIMTIDADGAIALVVGSMPRKITVSAPVDFGDAVFARGSCSIAALSRDKNMGWIIRDGQIADSFPVFTDLDIIACTGDKLLFCPDGCSVATACHRGVKLLFQAVSRIARIATDVFFKIVVVSTIDGFIHVFDLTTGSRVRSVDIGEEAAALLITRKWGYIIAMADGLVHVLTVNGVLVKQVRLKFGNDQNVSVIGWFPVVSRTDFDYVVFVTVDQKLGIFEAFYPEKAYGFHEVKEQVSNIWLCRATGSFMLLSPSGCVQFVPHPLLA